jgi:hypothetical protein
MKPRERGGHTPRGAAEPERDREREREYIYIYIWKIFNDPVGRLMF